MPRRSIFELQVSNFSWNFLLDIFIGVFLATTADDMLFFGGCLFFQYPGEMEFGMKWSFSIALHGLVVFLCHLVFPSPFFVDFPGKLLFWFSMVSGISALD